MVIDVNKPPRFVVCKIPDYTDLYSEIPKLRSFIFRGQRSPDWKVTSSLQRYYDKEHPRQMIEGIEHYSIEFFKKRIHHYDHLIPHSPGIIDLLAAMQHYGCPTRLVDFTRSFRTAVYFAVSDTAKNDKGFCVWAVNNAVLSVFSKDLMFTIFGSRDADYQLEQTINNLMAYKHPGILIAEPKYLSKRMSAQQGVLLAQTNLTSSFEFNLQHILETDANPETITLDELKGINQNIINDVRIIKFEFEDKNLSKVKQELLDQNLTSENLFPDLYGLARSAMEHLFWQ